MILPIVVYGAPILKSEAEAVSADYPDLQILIENMYETMYNAKGVGLAAPQIGLPLTLFIIDSTPMEGDELMPNTPVKQVFINAEIIEQTGENGIYEEGCLSFPDIRENVIRKSKITIRYCDETFTEHTNTFEGMPARVIQHEYDHIIGKTLIDRISPLKKTLLRGKLNDIANGKKTTFYKTKIYK
jgi:peptide deformylase